MKTTLTPKQIVKELDRYIIGQSKAKRAVAVALRNRYRRAQLAPELREEVTPKNILMKGPTGVGKTEIARRLAKLVGAPFLKVEATKFTEVGYVGRDVESMIRDLAEVSVRLVKEERIKDVEIKARDAMEKKLLDLLFPQIKETRPDIPEQIIKDDILHELRNNKLDNMTVEIEVTETPKMQLDMGSGMGIDIGSIFGGAGLGGKHKKKRKMTVGEAREAILQEESDKLIDDDSVNSEALMRAEQDGIIFIDEIDKIVGSNSKASGQDVSREGVQRDILPIVEGSSVMTKYGVIKTDHILFIAAGAFHISKVQDLIPELQGRFPVRVELDNLTKDDFIAILTQPDNALLTQYKAMLAVDKVDLKFTDEAIAEIAQVAEYENETSENIGARRLHTVMEQLLEDISFNACGEFDTVDVVVDNNYVKEHLEKDIKTLNLKKYII